MLTQKGLRVFEKLGTVSGSYVSWHLENSFEVCMSMESVNVAVCTKLTKKKRKLDAVLIDQRSQIHIS